MDNNIMNVLCSADDRNNYKWVREWAESITLEDLIERHRLINNKNYEFNTQTTERIRRG